MSNPFRFREPFSQTNSIPLRLTTEVLLCVFDPDCSPGFSLCELLVRDRFISIAVCSPVFIRQSTLYSFLTERGPVLLPFLLVPLILFFVISLSHSSLQTS